LCKCGERVKSVYVWSQNVMGVCVVTWWHVCRCSDRKLSVYVQ